MAFDLLVVGDCNPDLLLIGDDVEPEFGQREKLVETAQLVVGGSAAITACGAARLGLRTAFVGAVGDDQFGTFMLDALADRGVDVSGCLVEPRDPDWRHRRLGARRRPGDADRSGDDRGADRRSPSTATWCAPARHLHIGSYYLLDGLRPGLPGLVAEAHAARASRSRSIPRATPASGDGGLPGWRPRSTCCS